MQNLTEELVRPPLRVNHRPDDAVPDVAVAVALGGDEVVAEGVAGAVGLFKHRVSSHEGLLVLLALLGDALHRHADHRGAGLELLPLLRGDFGQLPAHRVQDHVVRLKLKPLMVNDAILAGLAVVAAGVSLIQPGHVGVVVAACCVVITPANTTTSNGIEFVGPFGLDFLFRHPVFALLPCAVGQVALLRGLVPTHGQRVAPVQLDGAVWVVGVVQRDFGDAHTADHGIKECVRFFVFGVAVVAHIVRSAAQNLVNAGITHRARHIPHFLAVVDLRPGYRVNHRADAVEYHRHAHHSFERLPVFVVDLVAGHEVIRDTGLITPG